jgi:hypothetical protein
MCKQENLITLRLQVMIAAVLFGVVPGILLSCSSDMPSRPKPAGSDAVSPTSTPSPSATPTPEPAPVQDAAIIPFNSPSTGVCPGVFIDKNILLTSAHCIMEKSKAVPLPVTWDNTAATGIIVHPSYKQGAPDANKFDMALQYFGSKTNATIKEICITYPAVQAEVKTWGFASPELIKPDASPAGGAIATEKIVKGRADALYSVALIEADLEKEKIVEGVLSGDNCTAGLWVSTAESLSQYVDLDSQRDFLLESLKKFYARDSEILPSPTPSPSPTPTASATPVVDPFKTVAGSTSVPLRWKPVVGGIMLAWSQPAGVDEWLVLTLSKVVGETSTVVVNGSHFYGEASVMNVKTGDSFTGYFMYFRENVWTVLPSFQFTVD